MTVSAKNKKGRTCRPTVTVHKLAFTASTHLSASITVTLDKTFRHSRTIYLKLENVRTWYPHGQSENFKMYPCTLVSVPSRDYEALGQIDVDFLGFKSLLLREIPLNLDCSSTRISHVPFAALSC